MGQHLCVAVNDHNAASRANDWDNAFGDSAGSAAKIEDIIPRLDPH